MPARAHTSAFTGLSFASFLRFWAVAASRNSSLAPLGPRNRRRPSLRMRLRWPTTSRTSCADGGAFIGRRVGKRPGNVAGILVEIAGDLSSRRVRTAGGLECATITVALAGAIEPRPILGDARSRRCIGPAELHQQLALGTGVMVLLCIEDEVRSRQGTIGPVGLVEHRDMRRDPTLLDQPGQVRGRSVGTIGDKSLRLQPEAFGGPVEHGA